MAAGGGRATLVCVPASPRLTGTPLAPRLPLCRAGGRTTAAAASGTATAASRCGAALGPASLCFHQAPAPGCTGPALMPAAPPPPLLQRERSGGPSPPEFGFGRDGRDGRERDAWDPPPPFGAGKRGRFDDRGSPRFGPPGFQPPPERGGGWYDGGPRHFGSGPGFGRGACMLLHQWKGMRGSMPPAAALRRCSCRRTWRSAAGGAPLQTPSPWLPAQALGTATWAHGSQPTSAAPQASTLC